MLLPVPNDAERRVHDAPVRVDGEGDAEVELAVPREAVEPVAVVGVAVAGRGVRQRLWRLVQGVVVVSGEHGFLPRAPAPATILQASP